MTLLGERTRKRAEWSRTGLGTQWEHEAAVDEFYQRLLDILATRDWDTDAPDETSFERPVLEVSLAKTRRALSIHGWSFHQPRDKIVEEFLEAVDLSAVSKEPAQIEYDSAVRVEHSELSCEAVLCILDEAGVNVNDQLDQWRISDGHAEWDIGWDCLEDRTERNTE